ncbi:Chitinase 7 [Carabus blaptoides fortunei]
MTYDLHGPWDGYTAQHTGLYASSKDVTALDKQLNVAACIDAWIRKGADPSKIILGIAIYGKSYTLDNPANHGLRAPATNPGNAGPYTLQQGLLGYNEIVELQQAGGWTKVWDTEQQVPYMFKGDQWVGYDDPESIKLKVEYAKSKGLGGVEIWSIETDDFYGLSGTKFALLEAINTVLANSNNPGFNPTTHTPNDSGESTQTPSSTEKPFEGDSPSSLYLVQITHLLTTGSKMKTIFTISAVLAIAVISSTWAAPDKVVCYYGSWAVYRQEPGKFDVEQIDPNLCTHIIYSFVGIGEDGSVRVLDAWNDLEENWGKGAFTRFVNLRKLNPSLKALVAIGGWNEGASRFSKVASSPQLRATFAKNVVDFVKKYNFDGFDVDWEYPTKSDMGGKPEDLVNFSSLLKELSQALKSQGLLLTAAVGATEQAATTYYQVPELSKYLDFINVMTYDIHGPWDGMTGHNAPLNPSSRDMNPYLNVKACIQSWINHGADPAKLVLGMPTYGKSFTISNPSTNGVGVPSIGDGQAGPYTKQRGMLGYNEIVEKLRDGQLTELWDAEQEVPYAYSGNFWLSYDNERSIGLKVDYAKQMGLGGTMIWSIETDDFNGVSGTKFPLLRTINKHLGRPV